MWIHKEAQKEASITDGNFYYGIFDNSIAQCAKTWKNIHFWQDNAPFEEVIMQPNTLWVFANTSAGKNLNKP